MKQIEWSNGELSLLDQRKLPLSVEYLKCVNFMQVYDAIKTLAVRGAPLIGVAAAMGVVLASKESAFEPLSKIKTYTAEAALKLRSARPTAVNLMWALDRMLPLINSDEDDLTSYLKALEREALAIWAEDIDLCDKIGAFGAELIPRDASIITHCNTGSLATAGSGTALSVIRHAFRQGKNIHVYADETRPLLQGSRLTVWELCEDRIPCTLICDNMAAHVMKTKNITLAITGADRIASNGDSANKIGTYGLAIAAAYHGIPFYIAAPYSTVDLAVSSGKDIVIEERQPDEVCRCGDVRVAPEICRAFNPAFDVTPAELITGIITDKGVIYPPYDEKLRKAALRK